MFLIEEINKEKDKNEDEEKEKEKKETIIEEEKSFQEELENKKKEKEKLLKEIEDMDRINKLLLDLLSDLSLAVNDKGGKDQAYRILNVMHNLPKAFYGKDILGGTGRISVQEAVEYASMSMTPEMKEKYIDSTF